jgi:hypothetical protein
MEKIYSCHCGCGTIVWKDGENELTFQNILGNLEIITHVDYQGFINGKYSIFPAGLEIVEFELQFMRNIK